MNLFFSRKHCKHKPWMVSLQDTAAGTPEKSRCGMNLLWLKKKSNLSDRVNFSCSAQTEHRQKWKETALYSPSEMNGWHSVLVISVRVFIDRWQNADARRSGNSQWKWTVPGTVKHADLPGRCIYHRHHPGKLREQLLKRQLKTATFRFATRVTDV